MSKKRWNKRTFKEIGTNTSKAKGTHFLNSNNSPMKISKKPIRGNTYPEAESELIKLEAPSGSWGRGIKLKSINLFNPKNISMRAKTMRRILVNVEFISDGFWVT